MKVKAPLTIILVLFSFSCVYSQTKKEQIELLNSKIDSLSKLILFERNDSFINYNKLQDSIKNERSQNDSLRMKQERYKQEIISLRDENNIQRKLIEIKLNELENMQNKYNMLSDSLKRIDAILVDMKSAPKHINRYVPENNYIFISDGINSNGKDVTDIRAWISIIVKSQHTESYSDVFTRRCFEYVGDAMDLNHGYPGSIDEDTFRKKWINIYDLNYSVFSQIFESGNCGWGTQKVSKIRYLGELNSGDWFELTIEGGCLENDTSETITRVIKIVKENGVLKIDNFIALTTN